MRCSELAFRFVSIGSDLFAATWNTCIQVPTWNFAEHFSASYFDGPELGPSKQAKVCMECR